MRASRRRCFFKTNNPHELSAITSLFQSPPQQSTRHMITVFGRPDSSAVARAMWAVGELGLAHESLQMRAAYRAHVVEKVSARPQRIAGS